MQEQIPQTIEKAIQQAVQMLIKEGPQYQSQLIAQKSNNPLYSFFFPKSPYYKHYIRRFSQKTKQHQRQQTKQNVQSMQAQKSYYIEGTVQDMSVGGMCQITKSYMRQDYSAYSPLEQQIYSHQINVSIDSREINKRVSEILHHIGSIYTKRASKEKEDTQQNNIQKKKTGFNKRQEARNQISLMKDGSMGSFGGKKYQGLGSRDALHEFRKQQSQNYYNKIGQKKRTQYQ